MKKIIYVLSLFIIGSAFAQDKATEVNEKVQTKTVKVNDGEKISEKKVKVITRETSNVKLDKADENEVNQNRVHTISKVEKMTMIDNDVDGEYDFLTKDTYYKIGDKNYLFKPNSRGFDIAFNNNKSKFTTVESVLSTHKVGNYLINSEDYAGIGYFNSENDFVIEYYDKNSDSIKIKTYNIAKTNS